MKIFFKKNNISQRMLMLQYRKQGELYHCYLGLKWNYEQIDKNGHEIKLMIQLEPLIT